MSTFKVAGNTEIESYDISEAGTCLLIISKFIIIGTDNGKLVRFNNEDKTYINKKLHLDRIECLTGLTASEFWLSGDTNIYLYDIQLNQKRKIEAHLDLVASLVSDGNTLMSASEDTTVRFWDYPYSKSEVLYSHEFPICCMEYCDHKKLIASSDNDSNLYLYSFTSKEIQKTVNESQGRIWCIRFISESNYLLTADNDSYIIFRDSSNISLVIRMMQVHESRISNFCVNNQKNLIATCGFDRTVYLIDSPQMLKKEKVLSSPDWVRSVQFTNDGSSLVIVGDDKKLTICKILQRIESCSCKSLKVWMNLAINGILLVLIMVWWVIGFNLQGLFIFLFLGVMVLAGFVFYEARVVVDKSNRGLQYVLIANLIVVLIVPLSLIIGCSLA